MCCCGRACCCGSFTAGCQGVPVACKGGGAVSWLLHVPCPARVPVLWLVAGGKRLRQFVGVGCSHGQLVGVGRLGTWLVTSRVFLCSFSCTCVLSTLGVRGLLRCGLRVSSRSGKVLLNFSVRCVELLVVLGRQGSSRSSLCSDLWPAKALGTRATRALGAPSAELTAASKVLLRRAWQLGGVKGVLLKSWVLAGAWLLQAGALSQLPGCKMLQLLRSKA